MQVVVVVALLAAVPGALGIATMNTNNQFEARALRLFQLCDQDHDGYLTQNDCNLLMKGYAATPGAHANGPTLIQKTWSSSFGMLGSQCSPQTFVSTLEQFGSSFISNVVGQAFTTFFSLDDVNQDGFVECNEFEMFRGLLGIVDNPNDPQGITTCGTADTNGNGKLEQSEYVSAAQSFTTNCKTPLMYFMGTMPVPTTNGAWPFSTGGC